MQNRLLLLSICLLLFFVASLKARSAQLVVDVTTTAVNVDGSIGPFTAANGPGALVKLDVNIEDVDEKIKQAALSNFPPGIPFKVQFLGKSKSLVNTNKTNKVVIFDEFTDTFRTEEILVTLKAIKRAERARARAQKKNKNIPLNFRIKPRKLGKLGLSGADVRRTETIKEASILPAGAQPEEPVQE